MENIFENAYFGKAYKTRDGRKAIYIKHSQCDDGMVCVIYEGIVGICMIMMDGHYWATPNVETDYDIVSEWQDEINEEELNNILDEAENMRISAEGRKLTGGWYWRKWAEWGYRKAKENK